MTSDQPLPFPVKNALGRAFLYARETPVTPEDREDVVLAAHTLALMIQRVCALTPSQIGADEFLAEFDGDYYDSYSFYRGVEFALTRVRNMLTATEVGQ